MTEYVLARYPFNEDRARTDVISFSAGAVIELLSKNNDEWWTGCYIDASGTKCQGAFPANFVEPHNPTALAPPSIPAAPSTKKAATSSTSVAHEAPRVITPCPNVVQMFNLSTDPFKDSGLVTIDRAPIHKVGFLSKNKHIKRENNWKARYVVLKDDTIAWYKDVLADEPLGSLHLFGAQISKSGRVTMKSGLQRPGVFVVAAASGDYMFACCSSNLKDEVASWQREIARAIKRAKAPLTKKAAKKAKKNIVKEEGGFIDMGACKPLFSVSLKELAERGMSVSLPVHQIVHYMKNSGQLGTVGIFRETASTAVVSELREFYNKGQQPELSSASIHVVANLLRVYFRNLPEPIIPRRLYSSMIAARDIKTSADRLAEYKRVLLQLDLINRTTLVLLIDILQAVARQPSNSMTAENLALVWSGSVMQPLESMDTASVVASQLTAQVLTDIIYSPNVIV